MILSALFYVLIECKFISNMKKRFIKKQFNKIAKKSIKENSYLFNKYGVNSIFTQELKRYLDFILNTKCPKEIYYVCNFKAYINDCVKNIEDYIYKIILNKMIHD